MIKNITRLQKVDKDTNELIEQVQKYLFSIGVRATKERAWNIYCAVHKIPYMLLINRNKEISYQGQGQHLSHKNQPNQILTIKDVGRYEIKAVSATRKQPKRAVIKFTPSKDIQHELDKQVKVIDNE